MISFIIKGIGLTVPQDSITHVTEAIVRLTGTLWVGLAIEAVLWTRVARSIQSTFIGRSRDGGCYSGRFFLSAGVHLPGFLATFGLYVVPDVWGAGVVPSYAKEALAVIRFATRSLVLITILVSAPIWMLRTIVFIAHGIKLDMSSLHRGQEKKAYEQRLVLHRPSY